MFFIFLNNVDSSVRGAAIDDDIFEIRVALINDGTDRRLNVANPVVYRGDKRDARPSRGFCRRGGSHMYSAAYRVGASGLQLFGLHRLSSL